MPVKFHSDTTIYSTNLVASRLYEILLKYVFSDIETGPRCTVSQTVIGSTSRNVVTQCAEFLVNTIDMGYSIQ